MGALPTFFDATQVQVAGGAPIVVPQQGTTMDVQKQAAEPAQDANNVQGTIAANTTPLATTADPTLTVGPTDQPVQD